MGTAGGEGFASALLRLCFQDGKKHTDIRNYNAHKSTHLYKNSKNKKQQCINEWVSARNCIEWYEITEEMIYYIGTAKR